MNVRPAAPRGSLGRGFTNILAPNLAAGAVSLPRRPFEVDFHARLLRPDRRRIDGVHWQYPVRVKRDRAGKQPRRGET